MLGTTVVAGMSAATLLGIFFVPSLFVCIERIGGHRDVEAEPASPPVLSVAPAASAKVRLSGGE
jgi:hypothetical protein